MKIEMNPNFKFSDEEVKTADYFCALCDDIDKGIGDCWDEADTMQTIIEENIMMDWQDFYETVQRLTSFVHDHREG